jgi:uncharacterized protein
VGSSSVAVPRTRWQRVRRFLVRRFIVIGVAYLVICLVMWSLENRLVFYPIKATELWNNPPDPAIEEVFLTSPEGRQIHAWWLPHGPDAPVLLLCPGNAGNLSGRGQTMLKMAERLNTSVLIFDYPGYGKSAGTPNEPRCYDAGEAAIRWLRDEKGTPPERVTLYGESLGGGVATELATRYPCRALVLVKTFTLLPAVAKSHYRWLPTHWLMSNRFDTQSKLPNVHCPVFIASATSDRIVPFAHGELNFLSANPPKRFFRDEGSDHNDPLPDAFWDELLDFLTTIR